MMAETNRKQIEMNPYIMKYALGKSRTNKPFCYFILIFGF